MAQAGIAMQALRHQSSVAWDLQTTSCAHSAVSPCSTQFKPHTQQLSFVVSEQYTQNGHKQHKAEVMSLKDVHRILDVPRGVPIALKRLKPGLASKSVVQVSSTVQSKASSHSRPVRNRWSSSRLALME